MLRYTEKLLIRERTFVTRSPERSLISFFCNTHHNIQTPSRQNLEYCCMVFTLSIVGANMTASGNANLHYRPFSSHLTRAVAFGATSAHHLAKENNTWQGRIITLISKGSLFIGACFIVPLALIETITSLALATMALAAKGFLSSNWIDFLQKYSWIDFLQKYSLKFLSFALHSGVTAIVNFILAFRMPELHFHTVNALVDNGIYLGTAVFTQFVTRPVIDELCGTSSSAHMTGFNFLKDSYSDLFQDIASQIQRDFGIHLENIQALNQYFPLHPEELEILRNFQFERPGDSDYQVLTLDQYFAAYPEDLETLLGGFEFEQLGNPDYRAPLLPVVRRLLTSFGFLRQDEQGIRQDEQRIPQDLSLIHI